LLRGLLSDALARRSRGLPLMGATAAATGTGLSTSWRFQPSRHCSAVSRRHAGMSRGCGSVIASHQQNRLRNDTRFSQTKDDDVLTLFDNDTFAVLGLEDDRFAPIVLREALNFDLHHMKPFILHA
jgi:hypothetical protein